MKILFIGYYELKEHLKHIKKVLENYKYDVLNYPLFQYAYDSNDKLENYEEHLSNYIDDNDIDVILWWFLDVPVKVFKNIKKQFPSIYYILFNSDDPGSINMAAPKCEIFDLIMSPCLGCTDIYKKYNDKALIIWNPCGFDPKYIYPDVTEYDCDVSIICYDLLMDPYFSNQTVERKVLMDNVVEYCKNNNKKFNIYGTFALKEIYPDNYVSDVSYTEINSVINKSRINICTHTFNNYELGVTDMEFKILGAGGLLLMDSTEKIQEIFINGVNCMLYTKNDYISKINRILNDYGNYQKVKDNGYLLAQSYSWAKFVEKIHIEISKKYFDLEYYKKIYNVSVNNCWEYWLNVGLKNNHICYKLKILPLFDHEKYKEDNGLDKLDIESLYHMWFMDGRKKKYLKKSVKTVANNNIDFTSFNVNVEQVIELYSAFNTVFCGDIVTGLKKIAQISENNPRIKVNDALTKYKEITY
jgi:hypothetical protein